MDLQLENWLTTDQAHQEIGYSVRQLYRLALSGKVDARRLGKLWLFDRDSLLAHQATARHGPKRRKGAKP